MQGPSFVQTRSGRIAVRQAGAPDRPAVLLLHGIPTSSFLWRHVMAALAPELRCIAPDLMGLGDTEVDVARTDYGMPAQAEMLLELLDALGVERAHVVAHDQGGAAAQILAVRHRRRVDRLVLTNCVCYDNWPVPAVRRLQLLARLPGAQLAARAGLVEVLEARTPLSAFRRGFADPAALSADVVARYFRALRGTPDERARFLGFLAAGSPRHTAALVAALRDLDVPTLILWGEEDRYLPVHWARRLYRDIPGARLELVPGAGHFWPEEAPAPFAAAIARFLTGPLEAAAGPTVPPGAVVAGPPDLLPDRLARKCAMPAPKGVRS